MIPNMLCEESTVYIDQIRVRAFHGVLPQERTVGADFTVSVEIWAPLADAVVSDKVEDTVNYAIVSDIILQEMAVPSALLEHVAGRIAKKLFQVFPIVEKARVDIRKVNPPMGIDSDGAGVRICFVR